MTQYESILKHLRKHGSATVRDLLIYTNYPSARLYEMTNAYGRVFAPMDSTGRVTTERIDRLWTVRNGKKVRLYKLVRVK